MNWGLTNNKTLFKICSLFLLADGQWKQEEIDFLNIIANELEIGNSSKQDIMSYCRELKITKGDYSSKIIKEIDCELNNQIISSFEYNPHLQTKTIWTLINLGYADQEYSESEKKVIQHLIKKWKVNPIIISELTDTAETILMLTKKAEWLKTIGLSYDDTTKQLKRVEQQIQLMFENIDATISEADTI